MNSQRPKTFLKILAIGAFLFCAASAQADSRYRSKLGFDFSGFKPNLNRPIGWLAGLTWGQYIGDSQVYWGLGAYFGTPAG
ncbi:hypothetical protein EBT16_12345, partial [bacterium]|nr:hypothetical protein [bacterium]